uniref:Uncharacterized protein n=1 Tax=Utricularia reniformis TaxID=192314 RepID=A0A1Y0B3Z3_9LAMI|nr:hypothetical protein AEK19_MT1968 [Utricularia reniformis]ART32131.1 hypothetical protein AEK19_MT1968 [Utricularia reniformis]
MIFWHIVLHKGIRPCQHTFCNVRARSPAPTRSLGSWQEKERRVLIRDYQ